MADNNVEEDDGGLYDQCMEKGREIIEMHLIVDGLVLTQAEKSLLEVGLNAGIIGALEIVSQDPNSGIIGELVVKDDDDTV